MIRKHMRVCVALFSFYGSVLPAFGQVLPSLDQPGPWAVGYRTLTSKGAPVTSVWYPVAPADVNGDLAKYNVAEWTSAAGWRAVPYTSPLAHTGALVGDGPFPLVAYSHGQTGWATVHAWLMEHLASHGYVVAAVTHSSDTPDSFSYPARVGEVKSLIDRLFVESEQVDSPLFGRLDATRVAVVGDSRGGDTAMILAGGQGTLTPDPRVKAIVAIAPETTPATAAGIDLPTLEITGTSDFRRDNVETTFPLIGSDDRYLGILRSATHETLFNVLEPEARRIENLYTTAFLGRYLEGATEYDSLLTQSFAVANEPRMGFFKQFQADATNDLLTNLSDFGPLKDYFGSTGRSVTPRRGDFTRDRRVDLADFGALKLNFTGSAANVPEPGGLVLLGLGLIAAWGGSRCHRGALRATR